MTKIYKIKGKPNLRMDVVEKDDSKGEWVKTGETMKVEGKFAGIFLQERETEDYGTIRTVKVMINQGEDKAYIETSPTTAVGRSLTNTLLNLKKEDVGKDINISLYTTNREYNGETYENFNIALRIDGEMVKWAINPKDLPKPEKTKFQGKTLTDWTKTVDKLVGELKKVIDVSFKKEENKGGEEINADDLPFR